MEKTVLDRKTQDAPNIKRVAAYCRVATGGAGPLYGLEAQKAYYTQKINENPEWKIPVTSDKADSYHRQK